MNLILFFFTMEVKESVKQSFSYYRGDDGSVVDYGEDGNPHSQVIRMYHMWKSYAVAFVGF